MSEYARANRVEIPSHPVLADTKIQQILSDRCRRVIRLSRLRHKNESGLIVVTTVGVVLKLLLSYDKFDFLVEPLNT